MWYAVISNVRVGYVVHVQEVVSNAIHFVVHAIHFVK